MRSLTEILTIKLDEDMYCKLAVAAALRKTQKSVIVREALAAHLAKLNLNLDALTQERILKE